MRQSIFWTILPALFLTLFASATADAGSLREKLGIYRPYCAGGAMYSPLHYWTPQCYFYKALIHRPSYQQYSADVYATVPTNMGNPANPRDVLDMQNELNTPPSSVPPGYRNPPLVPPGYLSR